MILIEMKKLLAILINNFRKYEVNIPLIYIFYI